MERLSLFTEALGSWHDAHRRTGDKAQGGHGPHALEEADDRDLVELQYCRVDHGKYQAHADVHGQDELAQRAQCIPAVGSYGLTDEGRSANRGKADNPPQDDLNDL